MGEAGSIVSAAPPADASVLATVEDCKRKTGPGKGFPG